MVRLARLRYWREQRALTQRELADLAGMSSSTLNRVEQGLQDARISTMRRLAKALNVEPADLMAPSHADDSRVPKLFDDEEGKELAA